ncbi:hypothetical protein JCGZ_04400 [Jatropha curcas]|uniref:J domain-containing protein n=1 Tax=Jatropha curcas TaxID=180498 RepID=A0A067L1W3_JATCU|nr:J domain-containing protein required for chloroplast accumulation response 1 [Jatropha curcas]KDP38475.1 hypothetical protein JCGZ_04400 [Jatropha curcas]
MNHTDSSPKSPSSDIDFKDVFGGPPRRASMQEIRCSIAESSETYSLRKSDAVETSLHARRWSGLSEKPVFGEESINRRRYPSQDFFDDIFRCNDSFSSSPRKNDRDVFSSSPGSRVLSPGRPLPPRAEPFTSPSLPAQFSPTAKLIKGTDLPTFGSSDGNHHKNKDGTLNGVNVYSYSPLSRFSSQTNQVQEESRNDVCSKSSLLQEPFLSSEDPLNLAKPDEMDKGSNLEKDSNRSTLGSHFHFSIYKWASKGVPLALPLRGGNVSKLKEKIKFERSLSSSGRIACEGMAKELSSATPEDIDCSTFNNSISTDAAKYSEIELDRRENGSLFNANTDRRVERRQTVEETVLPKSVSPNLSTVILQNSMQETKPQSVLDKGSSGKIEQIPAATQATPKTLHSLMSGPDEMTIKNELKESKVETKKLAAIFDVSGKVKKQDGEGIILSNEGMDESNLQGSSISSRDSIAKNRGRGKVKEFVKIFNQEASNKPKFNEDSQIQSSGWKERGKFKPHDDADITTTEVNMKVCLPNANKDNTPIASITVDEVLKQSDERYSKLRTNNHKFMDISSGLKDRSNSNGVSVPDGSEAIIGDLCDSFQGNILIKELPQDEDEQPQAGDNQEEIQVIDAKIREWSNGKEGNIRSLLSTLQYVVWPESGWKPVPLVDIIEGNAVKRSYQKALLRLHPDKLQQKGATSHQKYIAEKVFDVLQEAWSHFNSVGSL